MSDRAKWPESASDNSIPSSPDTSNPNKPTRLASGGKFKVTVPASPPMPPEIVEQLRGLSDFVYGELLSRAADTIDAFVEATRALRMGEPTARQQLLDALTKAEGGA
jgi:hypothetical protein